MVILRLFTFLLKCAWSHLNCLSWQELYRDSGPRVCWLQIRPLQLISLYGLPAYIKNWTDYSHFKILLLELLLKFRNFIIFHWFCSLHWLPTNGRIIFKILLLVYKRLNDQSSSCISELLTAVITGLFLDHLHVGLLCRIILRLVRPTLHVNRMVIRLFPS